MPRSIQRKVVAFASANANNISMFQNTCFFFHTPLRPTKNPSLAISPTFPGKA